MVKAVIFDMDGVLIDSEPMWQQAEYQVFRQLGVPLQLADTKQTVGMTTKAVAEFWYRQNPWQGQSLAETEAVIIAKVRQAIARNGQAKDGVVALLQQLQQQKLPIAVATNSAQVLMDTTLDTLGIRDYFAAYCCIEMVEQGKPAPDIYLLAASQLGVAPADCLVFEDSITGIRAAKAAGMQVIALPSEEEWQHEKLKLADGKLRSLLSFELIQYLSDDVIN